jgi:glycosyltransferase involved in cell wall biosynthesis
MHRRVLIVQKAIPHYRRRFYDVLRELLSAEGVQLGVIYGQLDATEAGRGGVVPLEWGAERRTRFLPVGGRTLCWQPCLDAALRADLVIVEQASRLLVNYALYGAQAVGLTRLAFWGHGRTPTAAPPSRLGEAVKAALSRRVHWWFAYNDLSARTVRDLGFPPERITTVRNAIDTRALAVAAAAVTDGQRAALRVQLGLRGDNVGIYVGAMYEEKRLPFLIASCKLIREQVPDFEMLFVGSGPGRPGVAEAAARYPWLHDLGPRYGEELVAAYGLARLVLMPGRVGLGILDALTLGVPMVTTAGACHAPEIEYLEDGVNGVVVRDALSPAAYAAAVAGLLRAPDEIGQLRAGCRRGAALYSAEEMAARFAAGVIAALSAPSRARRHQRGRD